MVLPWLKFRKLNLSIIFFSVLAHQLFIPHPQGRKLSMVLYAASGLPVLNCIDYVVSYSMYCMKRAVHKISQIEIIHNIIIIKRVVESAFLSVMSFTF